MSIVLFIATNEKVINLKIYSIYEKKRQNLSYLKIIIKLKILKDIIL